MYGLMGGMRQVVAHLAHAPQARQSVLAESGSGRVVQVVLTPGASASFPRLGVPRMVVPRTDGVIALTANREAVLQDLYTGVPFLLPPGTHGSMRNVAPHAVMLDVAEPR
jgi:hypothetical protein